MTLIGLSDLPFIYPVVMAGGSGTRFWPASRKNRPKQLLPLLGDTTLLQQTVERLRPLAPPERTLVVTAADIVSEVRAQAPTIPDQNVLVEPVGRNTAAAIGFAAVVALARDPMAILAIVPSDHYIADHNAYLRVCVSAVRYAASGYIVTLGITPVRPETGYGYIRFSDFVQTRHDSKDPVEAEHVARNIAAFVEKPNAETAIRYLREGRYLWNSGMFFVRARSILDEIGLYLPDLRFQIDRIADSLSGPMADAVLRDAYQEMRSISIDYGVMEHSRRLVVIPSSFGWSDVGSWDVLSEFGSGEDPGGASFGEVVALDCEDNVLYAERDKVVAAIGVKGLIVALSGDAVLVCDKSRAQDVRRIVDALTRRGLTRFL